MMTNLISSVQSFIGYLPDELIDKICFPRHYVYEKRHDFVLTRLEKFCLCKVYNYLEDVTTQLKSMVREFEECKSMSSTWYWWGYRDAPPWVCVLRKSRWRKGSRFERDTKLVDNWKEKIAIMSLPYNRFSQLYLASCP